MSSPAAARGHEVRQRLLATAAELIGDVGWTAVSTRILADRAGVTPSVVHYHFSSLPALLNEAAIGQIRQLLAEVEAFLDTARTPAETVEAVLASVDRYTGADRTSLLAIEAYLAATRDERLREQIAGDVEAFKQRFGRWLGEHEVAAPEETATVLVAAVDGMLLHRGLGVSPDARAAAPVLRRLVT